MTSRGPSGTETLARDRPGRTRGGPVKPEAAEVGLVAVWLAAPKTASVLKPELPPSVNWGRPGTWAGLAACRDRPDVNFFPELDRKRARREVANARAVCSACPVRQACAQAGLYERFGVWGGLDEDDRRALRRAELRSLAVAVPRLTARVPGQLFA